MSPVFSLARPCLWKRVTPKKGQQVGFSGEEKTWLQGSGFLQGGETQEAQRRPVGGGGAGAGVGWGWSRCWLNRVPIPEREFPEGPQLAGLTVQPRPDSN